MAAYEWEVEDWEWRPTWLPAMACMQSNKHGNGNDSLPSETSEEQRAALELRDEGQALARALLAGPKNGAACDEHQVGGGRE
jgi:hypothetical protein